MFFFWRCFSRLILTSFAIFGPFDNENIDGPEPEIPNPIDPLSNAIFLDY